MQLPEGWMTGLDGDDILKIMLGADTSMFQLACPSTNVDQNGDIWSIFLREIRPSWHTINDRRCPAYYLDSAQWELSKRIFPGSGEMAMAEADPRWLAYICYCIAHWRHQHAAT